MDRWTVEWMYRHVFGRTDSPCILQDFVPFSSLRGRCPKNQTVKEVKIKAMLGKKGTKKSFLKGKKRIGKRGREEVRREKRQKKGMEEKEGNGTINA